MFLEHPTVMINTCNQSINSASIQLSVSGLRYNFIYIDNDLKNLDQQTYLLWKPAGRDWSYAGIEVIFTAVIFTAKLFLRQIASEIEQN